MLKIIHHVKLHKGGTGRDINDHPTHKQSKRSYISKFPSLYSLILRLLPISYVFPIRLHKHHVAQAELLIRGNHHSPL